MQAFWSEQSRSLLHSAAIGFIGQKERKLLRNREKEVYITKHNNRMRVWPRQSEDERNERGHLNTTVQAASIYKRIKQLLAEKY